MPLSITCDCGARFDVDDLLVDQEVPCPECTEPVKVSGQAAAPRNSLWALAALVVALVGALVPGGGLLAMLVGLIALLAILRRRKQLTGTWIALTAIGLGFFGSALTAALLIKPDLLPVGDWLRERALAGQFDSSGEMVVASKTNEVTLTRPNRDWGVMRRGYSFDPSISDLQLKEDQQTGQKPRADLLLYNRRRNAYADVIRDNDDPNMLVKSYRPILETQLNPYVPRFLGGDENGAFGPRDRFNPGGGRPEQGETPAQFDDKYTELDPLDGHLGRESRATVKRGGQTWRFIIRAYAKSKPENKPRDGPIHVIRVYTPLSRFKANEKEMTAILDSARIQP